MPSVAVQPCPAGPADAAANAAVQKPEAVSAGHSTSSSAVPAAAAAPVPLQCTKLTNDAADMLAAATLSSVWDSLNAQSTPDAKVTTASTTVGPVEVQQAQQPLNSKAGARNNSTISMPVSLAGKAYGGTSVPIAAGLKAAGLRTG